MTLYLPSLVGHIVATPPLPPLGGKAYDYIFAGNGIFLRAANAHFTAHLCVHSWPPETVRGLTPLEPSLTLRHPRLPRPLLHRIITDARTRCGTAGQLHEALYRVTLQEQDGIPTFALDIPPQQASAISVTAAAPTDAIVLELHSHGTLAAFWSTVDDADEGGMGLYGVLGHLDRDIVQIRLRVGIYSYWWDVPLSAVFEMEATDVQAATQDVSTSTARGQVQDLYGATPLPLVRYSATVREDV